MGIRHSGTITIQDTLFSSVQQRVLGILFGQPEQRFQSAQIIQMARAGTGAVHRLLKNLEASGLVNVVSIGNQKHYQANPDSPVFEELCGLMRKTVGLREPVAISLEQYKDSIVAAFIYGSVAKSTDTAKSDIDLMVIGNNLDYPNIYAAIQKAEATLHRPINPNLITPKEWQQKNAAKTPFVMRVQEQPKIFIYGSEHDIR
ncbi:MAG: nucleotidyltransferase domain-containing protein [Pseudohongiellaceae bacterium]